MYSLGLTAALSFFVSYLGTPLFRAWFVQLGWVDEPDGERKIHNSPVPRSGGVAIAFAYMASYAILAALNLKGWMIHRLDPALMVAVLPGTAIVFAMGLVDDVKGLRALTKLVWQMVASLIVFAGGLHVSALRWHLLERWWLSMPLTLFWLLLCTNAFNLIDGIDGLSSGLGLCATLTLICGALLSHNYPLLLAVVPLAGALLGFLPFNFNPATVFLGDSGSCVIGFLLGCYSIVWSQKSATLLGIIAPLIAFAVPLFDVALVVLRRLLRSSPIFSGDRLHVHHRLLEHGLGPRQVVLVLYGAAGFAALIALLSTFLNNAYGGVVLLLFCGATGFGIKSLGYQDLRLANRIVSLATFRQIFKSEMTMQTTREQLITADTLEAYWKVIRTMASELGCCDVSMALDDSNFFQSFDKHDSIPSWTITIPLEGGGHIALAHRFGVPANAVILGPLTDLLRSACKIRTEQKLKPKAIGIARELRDLRKAASG